MQTKTTSSRQRSNSNLKALAAFFGVAPAKKDAARADAQVAALLAALLRAAPELPAAPPLSDGERGRLLSLLFPQAGAVVMQTAEALSQHPERYPDSAESGPDLRDAQRRCDRLAVLETLLSAAAERCRDARRIEQGQLLQRALAVTTEVKSAATARAPQLDHDARLLPLEVATRPLQQHRARGATKRREVMAKRS